MVLATSTGDDGILRQITSQAVRDQYSISLKTTDFAEGSLQKVSNIRPNRLFTADLRLLLDKAGTVGAALYSSSIEAASSYSP